MVVEVLELSDEVLGAFGMECRLLHQSQPQATPEVHQVGAQLVIQAVEENRRSTIVRSHGIVKDGRRYGAGDEFASEESHRDQELRPLERVPRAYEEL